MYSWSNGTAFYMSSLHIRTFFNFLVFNRYAKEMSEKSFQLLGLIKRVTLLFKKLHEGKVCNEHVVFLIPHVRGLPTSGVGWGHGEVELSVECTLYCI